MANQDLINYFRQGIAAGNQIETLKEVLFNEGWPHDLINDAIIVVRNDPRKPKPLVNNHANNFIQEIIENNNPIPTGIKIIVGLHFLIAISIIVNQFLTNSIFEIFGKEITIPIKITLSLIFAAFPIVIGLGIWRSKSWSKMAGIIFSSIVILFLSISSYMQFKIINLIFIGICIFILRYLSINHKGAKYFHKK